MVAVGAASSASAEGVWDGGGSDSLWSTSENWDDDQLPGVGDDVEFGSAFTSGTQIDLDGDREVGTLIFSQGGTGLIIKDNTLTINSGITKSGPTANSDFWSAVTLPNDITISSSTGGRIRFLGTLSGSGGIEFVATGVASSLQLDGNNTGWSGGLVLQSGVANSVVNVFNTNGLGTGDVVWKSGSTGPSVIINGSYIIENDFTLEGTADRTLNTYNVSGGSGGVTELNGNISGDGASTIRFAPRATNITGHISELNGVNSNENASSRMVFFGSSNDSTSALGNTFVIGNNEALDWGRVILGQSSAVKEDIAFLYKDGITISRMIELNDDDLGDVTLGVYGDNSTATHAATIQVSNFSPSAETKQLYLTAGTGSQFTLAGDITLPGAGDTLSVSKIGEGVVVLSNASGTGINGSTSVSEGTLLVNNETGSGLGTSDVTVDGGTLGGTGLFSGSVIVNSGGTLAPGASIESLSSGGVSFADGSVFSYEVDSEAPLATGADLLLVNGDLSLTGTVDLELANLSLGTFDPGTVLSLINYDGTWDGGLFSFESDLLENLETFSFNSQEWQIEYDASVGGSNFSDEYLAGGSFVNITAMIPEVSAWNCTGLIALGAALFVRRRV